MNLSLPPNRVLLLAAVGIGAYWYLTRNKASAGMWPTSPAGQSAAARTGTVQSYLQPFSVAPAVQRAQASPPSITDQLTLAAGSRLIDRIFSGSSSAANVPSPGEIIRPMGYEPTYTPDTAGEAEAQAYYLNNQDEFIVNPPTVYAFNDGFTGGTGGYLDSQ